MVVQTDSERVRLSRKMVIEFLESSVDTSLAGPRTPTAISPGYAAPLRRRSGPVRPAGATRRGRERDAHEPGHHHAPSASANAATVAQPVKVDNDLYVRDYSKCILCYKCVEACGDDAQNTFAIAVAGRGFDARISTEWDVGPARFGVRLLRQLHRRLPDGRAHVQVRARHARRPGTWDPAAQTVTDTICPYCGVGCTLSLHVQDNSIVKVTSPLDASVTDGHLCIKGRFGFEFVQNRER